MEQADNLLEGETVTALSLGSNLGDRPAYLREARSSLEKGGFRILRFSPVYETEPLGCEDDSGKFLNQVLIGAWRGRADQLLALLKKIEREAGRPETHPHWCARTLDIDIVLFGEETWNTEHLTIPHPRARERAFVMEGLFETAPELVFPDTGKSVGQTRRPPAAGITLYSGRVP